MLFLTFLNLFFSVSVSVSASETTLYLGPIEKTVETGEVKTYISTGNATAVKSSVNSTKYLHSDHLGSTELVTDVNGVKITTLQYYPYGDSYDLNQESGIMNQGIDKLYTNQRKDSSSGLYYYNARYYNPITAKFISADKAQGPNRYAYVGNNPIIRNDPSGMVQADPDNDTRNIFRPGKTISQPDFVTYIHKGGIINFQNQLSNGGYPAPIISNISQDFENISKSIQELNPNVYEDTLLAFSSGWWVQGDCFSLPVSGEFVLDISGYYLEANKYLVEMESLANYQIVESTTDPKMIAEYPYTFRWSKEHAQQTGFKHEYFHVWENKNPEVAKNIRSAYLKYAPEIEDRISVRKDYMYSDDLNNYPEMGPIVAVEMIYHDPDFYQTYAPDLYDAVYYSGFYREGVLPKPGQYNHK